MARVIKSIGFGFIPQESNHHFIVVTSMQFPNEAIIYENYNFNEGQNALPSIEINKRDLSIKKNKDYKPKARISIQKWNLIKESLKNEFNKRSKDKKVSLGKWEKEVTFVEKFYGKELLLLVWAIEDDNLTSISNVSYAIRNWNGLSPEERWWLYTMTNASTGRVNDRRGWRAAIKCALTDNPVDELNRNQELIESFF